MGKIIMHLIENRQEFDDQKKDFRLIAKSDGY